MPGPSNMVGGPNLGAVVMPLVRLLSENGSELSWSNREMIAAAISDAMRVHKSMLDEQRHISGGVISGLASFAAAQQSEQRLK